MNAMRWFVFYSMLLISCSLLSSNGFTQTTGAAFLKDGQSPAASALGGSDVVTSWGSEAIGANPALLGQTTKKYEATTFYGNLIDGAQYGQIAGVMSLNASGYQPLDAIGFSVQRLAVDGMAGADALGNQSGTFGSQDMAVSLSQAARVTKNFRVGLTETMIQSSLAGYSAKPALAGNVGASYTFSNFHGATMGFSIDNFGQGIQYIQQTNPLPTTANLGATVPLGGVALAVVSATENLPTKQADVGVGFAAAVGPMTFRAGYMAQGNSSANLAAQDQSGVAQMLGGFVGGFGLNMGALKLDYSVGEAAADLGMQQKLALTMAWGNKAAAPQGSARKNTQVINNQSSWNSGNSDTIDWHMINVEK